MNKNILFKFKRIFLLLFVFSIPFEYWDPFGVSSFFSVTKMAGFAYAAMAFLTIRDSFDLKIFKYVKLLLIFWILLLVLSHLNYTSSNTVSIFNFTILQNIILYWLITSDLIRGNIRLRAIILSFLLSIILMSTLLSLGIGVKQDYVENLARITFFGNNPNTVGVLAGLGIVFSLYFILNPSQNYGSKSYLIILAIPSFIMLLLHSGSRGALITLVMSAAIMLITNKATPFKRILQIGLLIIASTYFMEKLVESELMYKRITLFVEEGNTAGRGEIWENVLEIASKRPIIGYGTTGFENEMRVIYGGNKDSHNLFLYVLVTTGIIGLSLFLYFLYFHFEKVVYSFKQGNVLGLILLIFYLTTVFKGGGIIKDKLMWLLLAIIFSGFSYLQNKQVFR